MSNGMVVFGVTTPEGVFVAGAGTTQAEALHQLVGVFGEDAGDVIVPRVSAAVAHLGGQLLGDEEVVEAVPHRDGGGDPDEGAGRDGDPVPPATAGASDGGRDEPAVSDDGHACSVCGDAVPEGWAEVSLEDYGHIQCRSCSV